MTRLVAAVCRCGATDEPFDAEAVLDRYCASYPSDATTRFERKDHAPGPARRHHRNGRPGAAVPRRHPGRAADRLSRDHGAPESKYNQHDVPIHYLVRDRTSVCHAAPAPSSECLDSALLRHERLHKLPRDRRADRHCPLPDLRVRPPRPLTRRARISSYVHQVRISRLERPERSRRNVSRDVPERDTTRGQQAARVHDQDGRVGVRPKAHHVDRGRDRLARPTVDCRRRP